MPEVQARWEKDLKANNNLIFLSVFQNITGNFTLILTLIKLRKRTQHDLMLRRYHALVTGRAQDWIISELE